MITNFIKNCYNSLSNTQYNFYKKTISITSITRKLLMIGGSINRTKAMYKILMHLSKIVMMSQSIVMIKQRIKLWRMVEIEKKYIKHSCNTLVQYTRTAHSCNTLMQHSYSTLLYFLSNIQLLQLLLFQLLLLQQFLIVLS